MENPKLCRMSMVDRFGLKLLYARDYIVFGGDQRALHKMYHSRLMRSLRMFCQRNERYVYELKMKAPRIVIRNELILIIGAIHEMARWEYLCKMAGRWVKKERRKYAEGNEAD